MARHRGTHPLPTLLLVLGTLLAFGEVAAADPLADPHGEASVDPQDAADPADSVAGTEDGDGDTAPSADPSVEDGEGEAAAEETAEPDPCRPEDEGGAWVDIVQRGIFRSVCSSARWFDGFFGDARFDNEAEETYGRLSLETIHDEHDGFEANVRFRAEVQFPNLDHRINAFLGREDEDDYVTGRNEGFEARPDFFRDDVEREWLVGLGYHPVHGSGTSNRLDFQVGVKIRFPLEPFVQGRYRRHWFFGTRQLVRFRNTLFWRNQRGFGDTLTLDLEQTLARPLLLRWSTSGTFSEVTEGVDWYSSLTLFQSLGDLRAIAWTAYLNGETDQRVPLDRYGLRAIYRQQLHREWLYGQLIGGVSLPRDPGVDREISWELGVGVELLYGRHPRER